MIYIKIVFKVWVPYDISPCPDELTIRYFFFGLKSLEWYSIGALVFFGCWSKVIGGILRTSDRPSRNIDRVISGYLRSGVSQNELRGELDCYVTTELRGELGRYVATRLCTGCYAETLFESFSDFSWMCFLRKILRKINIFRRFIFRKNVHADFYWLSDIDFVVTDFDPNS